MKKSEFQKIINDTIKTLIKTNPSINKVSVNAIFKSGYVSNWRLIPSAIQVETSFYSKNDDTITRKNIEV